MNSQLSTHLQLKQLQEDVPVEHLFTVVIAFLYHIQLVAEFFHQREVVTVLLDGKGQHGKVGDQAEIAAGIAHAGSEKGLEVGMQKHPDPGGVINEHSSINRIMFLILISNK